MQKAVQLCRAVSAASVAPAAAVATVSLKMFRGPCKEAFLKKRFPGNLEAPFC